MEVVVAGADVENGVSADAPRLVDVEIEANSAHEVG